MVVGAVQGASCFGPAYEFAKAIMETDLRKRKIRRQGSHDLCDLRTLSGNLGLNGMGDSEGFDGIDLSRQSPFVGSTDRSQSPDRAYDAVTEHDETTNPKKGMLPFQNCSMIHLTFKG